MATFGAFLTVGGASLAGVALLLLRSECCPRCGTAGALETVEERVKEIPSCSATVWRLRRCGECRALLEDGRVLAKPAWLPWEGRRVRELLAR